MTTKNTTKNTGTNKKITVSKGENKKIIPATENKRRGRKQMTEEEKAVAREKRAANIAAFFDQAVKNEAAELGLETLPALFIEKHRDALNKAALVLYRASKGTRSASGKRNLSSITAQFITKRWAANMKKKEAKRLTIEDFKAKIHAAIDIFDPNGGETSVEKTETTDSIEELS